MVEIRIFLTEWNQSRQLFTYNFNQVGVYTPQSNPLFPLLLPPPPTRLRPKMKKSNSNYIPSFMPSFLPQHCHAEKVLKIRIKVSADKSDSQIENVLLWLEF
jgi:hypothetical protein